MAKGLRSKTARKFRAIKRESVFLPTEKSRLERLVKLQNNEPQPEQPPKRFSFLIKSEPIKSPREIKRSLMKQKFISMNEIKMIDTPMETIDTDNMDTSVVSLQKTKLEKQAILLSRNAFKKKSKALKKKAKLIRNASRTMKF